MGENFFNKPTRDHVIQRVNSFAVSVLTTPTPITENKSLLSGFIDSILIGVPGSEAQGVFFGGANVATTTGFPIEVGTSVNLALNNSRQLYELQYPLQGIADMLSQQLQCTQVPSAIIPVVVFDPAQLFMIAAATTDVRVVLFPSAYV